MFNSISVSYTHLDVYKRQIVKRASLHNADIIEGLDLHIGDMVYVEKGGEIIPKITGPYQKCAVPSSPYHYSGQKLSQHLRRISKFL